MSAIAHGGMPLRLSGTRLANAALVGLVFMSGFVMVEPSPYDLGMLALILVWSAAGLRISRYILPLTILLLLYLAGGLIALTQMETMDGRPVAYMVTTGYLVASAIFFAAIVSDNPEERLRAIRTGYIAAAVVVALIGILAYFNAIPYADLFKLYARAKGSFKDPNVFGPFLALPIALLFRDIITRRLDRSLWWRVAVLIVLLFGVLLSFSRAAWGLVAFELLAIGYLVFANEPNRMARLKLVGYFAGGLAAIALFVVAAISIPQVRNLYEVRAHVVQDYDNGHAGRFERQKAGFFLVQEKPLGIGPLAFDKIYGEDEHNMWLKGFTTYGWLGGFSYIILAAWTLAAGAPLLFKPRPWQGIAQCAYVVLLGHILVHNVIDNDHWRHLYLIYGMVWGMIAAEKLAQRRERGAAEPIPRAEPVLALERAHALARIDRERRFAGIERAPKPASAASLS